MEIIAFDESFRERYPLQVDIDFEVGDSSAQNNFEIKTADAGLYGVYVPGTEFGGIIEYDDSLSSSKNVTLKGWTWRGLLTQWIIEPLPGNDYRTVSGELHTVMRELLSEVLGGFFIVPDTNTGINVDYQFKLHCLVLDGLMDLLREYGCKLKIVAERTAPGKAISVSCEAVPEEKTEGTYDADTGLSLRFTNNRMGINHLICWGKGELKDRQRIDLYLNEGGNIGSVQYYTGLLERQAVFDYGNAESLEDLQANGIKRLKEICSSKKLQIEEVTDIDLDVGDIVVGRKNELGLIVESPIIRKIFRISGGIKTLEYKVKGEG